MFHFSIVRNLRTAVWLLVVAMIPLALGGLYWANNTGLPEEWRNALEQQMSNQGAHVSIGSLAYVPLKGFVAKSVTIFAEEERINEISNLERVQLVLDNTSLAGGKFRLRKVVLNNARLSLPVDPKEPTGQALHFNKVNASIFMPEDRLIEIEDARGNVGGVDVTLSAKFYSKGGGKGNPDDEKQEGKRREMIAHILNELQHWSFDPNSPPSAHINITGDMNDKSTLDADFHIVASYIEKKQYRVKNVTTQGRLSGYLLTVDSFEAEDSRGSLAGHADYQILKREGRFDIDSSIEIPRLLKSWLDYPLKMELLLGGKQQVQFAGEFNIPEQENPEELPEVSVKLTGHALCESVMLRGITFDAVESWFSWQDGDLFLRDMKLTRPDGTAKVKALLKGDIVKLSLHSTFPAPIFGPLFKGKPLEKIIADFSENTAPFTEVFLDGSFNLKDRFAWQYEGHGNIRNLSFRGVPVRSANCSFKLDRHQLNFFDGKVTFDYSDYSLRKSYNGPTNGSADIGRILYDHPSKTVSVEGVEGSIWAAPLVRFFAPAIADNLEQYRFHTPPRLSGSGIVDITPQGRTKLDVDFSSDGPATYKFLGEDVELSAPSANVKIRGGKVEVDNLKAEAFGGQVTGEIVNSATSALSGEFSVSKLSMAKISSTYDFEMKGGGIVTGRIEFTLPDGDVSRMDGKGLVGLENAELFSVPVFGPLSPVMAKVLADRRAGFERAKAAFCTFTINDGVLSTRDFQTSTTSVNFTGDGSVDLSDRVIDFTIRLNARGLLGIITLPLRPFTGLFQFHGKGPLKDSTWESVRFTPPSAEQNEALLRPPPKALIIAE
ncbi:AsmA-like C-terminal region-containing protein [Luteolibacter sp. AS25]|uniref:AsmA-like C-terminal region-containing protein n=1 Tax=Luteolibacter sp. AS25 TaxID=3135776 RepID=UPI00398B9ECC